MSQSPINNIVRSLIGSPISHLVVLGAVAAASTEAVVAAKASRQAPTGKSTVAATAAAKSPKQRKVKPNQAGKGVHQTPATTSAGGVAPGPIHSGTSTDTTNDTAGVATPAEPAVSAPGWYSYDSQNVPYVDLNPYVRAWCDLLNVSAGSGEWLQFGCELNPGQTGGQADFGWRQDHRVPPVSNPRYVKTAAAILANAGHRPVFYIDPPKGLRKGLGRPWAWVPIPGVDDIATTGWNAPNGKIVIGHDLQHFSLKFIDALARKQEVTEQGIAAKFMMWRFAAQAAGMLRTDYYKNSIHSSREVGRLFDFVVDCAESSIIDDQDAETFLAWTENAVIPAIQPDGVGFIIKPGDVGYKIEPNLGNVPYWFPWQDGIMAVGMDRLGAYLEKVGTSSQQQLGTQVRVLARKVAVNMANFITEDGAVPKAVGLDGKLSWVENEKYGYGVWCYRALRLAGANKKADAVLERYKKSPEWYSWFVEIDGNYNGTLGIPTASGSM